MSISVTLSPLDVPVPGQALLNIRGWEESSTALEFAIQRGRDEFYLQQGEQWSSNPYWFKVDCFNEVSGNLQRVIGKDVVDPLLSASSSGALQFRLRLQDGSVEDEQTMKLKDGLLSSLAGADQGGYTSSESGGLLQQPVEPTPATIPEAEPTKVEPPKVELPDIPAAPLTPVATPLKPVTTEPTASSKNNIPSWLIPLILLLLIAIGAGGWFFMNKDQSQFINSNSSTTPSANVSTSQTGTRTDSTTTENAAARTTPAESSSTEAASSQNATTAEVTSVAASPDAAAPCSKDNMEKLSEMMFVQGCVKSAPSSAEILKTINAAKSSNKCSIAQRLYAYRGQAGDIEVATAYAHEYDPKYHQPSDCFKSPDAATAAYWYETILGQDPENSDAKQRFEELKP